MKVLILINKVGLGDCIIHINYIHEISKKYGKPVSILAKANTKAKDLFGDDPYIDEVITLERLTDNSGSHDRLSGFFKLAKDIKKKKFDKVFIFNSSLRYFLICKLAGIKKIAQYPLFKKKGQHIVNTAKIFTENELGKIVSTQPKLIINKENNTIWSHEHGPQGGDEINLLEGGENYGWPKVTHGEEYGGGKIGKLTQKGFKDPKWIWVPSIAPSGMAFYNGNMFPELNNHLLIGSLKFKQIHAIKILNGHPVLERKLLNKSYGRIRDLEVMNDGSILFITDEDKSGRYKGGLYKIFKK